MMKKLVIDKRASITLVICQRKKNRRPVALPCMLLHSQYTEVSRFFRKTVFRLYYKSDDDDDVCELSCESYIKC
jgi:hypothetical protein